MKITEILAILEQWKSNGELFVSLSPPFSVTLEVDRTIMRDALGQSGLTESEFRECSTEIGFILLNILNGTEDRYLEGGLSNSPEEIHRTQRKAYVQDVKSSLYDDYLQGRYDLKRSSKAPSFNGIDWDIKVKQYDANFDEFRPFAYATLRLSFQRDFEDSAFSVLGGQGLRFSPG